jgi:exodeoxyribonuclease VII large subunit
MNPNSQVLSLHKLLNGVQKKIKDVLPNEYWVYAEIARLHLKSNVAYLELCDHKLGDEAKVSAVVWRSNNDPIGRFEQQSNRKLTQNLNILTKVRVQFHPRFGMQLQIIEIDPAHQVGSMELQKDAIRKAVINSGIYEANKSRPKPWDFSRVAIIAPQKAAGLEDFYSILSDIKNNDLCAFDLYHATYQSSEKTHIEITQRIKQAQVNNYDAIILIRGGGGAIDLYPLNHQDIVVAICESPIPVFTGIGHERDRTLLDEVANMSFATPSAVANYVEQVIVDRSLHVKDLWQSIKQRAALLTERVQHQTERKTQQDQISVMKYGIIITLVLVATVFYLSSKAS